MLSLTVRSTTDTSAVGTRKAMPVSLPLRAGMTLATALAAPVEDGMPFAGGASRRRRQSFFEAPSTTFWVAVMAWNNVMRPSSMPNLSLMALTMGARLLVVQDAQETTDHGRVVSLADAHDDESGSRSPGRGREDDLLGAGGDAGRDLVGREEGAGGLADVLGAHRAEGDLGRVALLCCHFGVRTPSIMRPSAVGSMVPG